MIPTCATRGNSSAVTRESLSKLSSMKLLRPRVCEWGFYKLYGNVNCYRSLTQIPVEQDRLLQVQQLMQLLLIIISKGVDGLEVQSFVRIAESVGGNLHSTSRERTLLHETFLTFATIIRQRCPGYNDSESFQVLDMEMMRHIGSETRDLAQRLSLPTSCLLRYLSRRGTSVHGNTYPIPCC